MKIDGAGRTISRGPVVQKKSKSIGTGFALADPEEDNTAVAATSTQSSAFNAPVLALQEVPPTGVERRRAIKWAYDLLDLLEELRVGILFGRVAKSELAALLELVSRSWVPSDDPCLTNILMEIELRASVELAKLDR